MADIPKNIKASLYIDGKPAEASIKNVQQVARTLEKELNHLTIGTDAWNKKMLEVQANKRYLQEIRSEINGVGAAFNQQQSQLGKIGTMAAGFLSLQFISQKFMGAVASCGMLSDSLADLRRVTGMSDAAVTNLDASLGDLETRTSKGGLRDIAVIAGKLGVSKDEILGFVQATDKLTVSLGDELGSADEITTKLGKILNVFDGSVNADNMTKLGNTFIGLANAGVASGGFLSDFTQRMAPIAKTAGMSLSATVALGAAIEELGGRSESSATAVSHLLGSIAADMPAAAKIANMSAVDFKKLFDENAEQGLLAYTKGLMANKAAFSDVSKGLKEAGEEGARVVTTIAMLGSKTDFVNQKIKMSNELIKGASEINQAFELKNKTLGAQMDKVGKSFASLTTNTTLVAFFTSLFSSISSGISFVNTYSNAILNFVKVLTIAAVSWGAYSLATKIAKAEKLSFLSVLLTAETLQKLQTISTTAMSMATYLFSGNLKRAAVEWRALNLAMGTNPWGLAIAAVVALGAAFVAFRNQVTNADKIQRAFNDIQAEAIKGASQEKSSIEALLSVLHSETATREQKNAAITKLQEMMPDYLAGYSKEEIAAGKADKAIQAYISTIERKAKAEASGKKLADLDGEIADLEAKQKSGFADASFMDQLKAGFKQKKGEDQMQSYKRMIGQQITDLKTQRDEIKKAFQVDVKESLIPAPTPTGSGSAATAEIKSLDTLKAKLEQVTKDRAAAAVGSAVFNQKTREMLQLQKEIDSYSSKPKPAKKTDYSTQAIKEFEKLDADYKKLNLQRLNDQLSENEKEVKQDRDKYDALIKQEQDFQKTKDPKNKLGKQKAASKVVETDLVTQRETSTTAIRLRQEKEMLDAIQDLRNNMLNIQAAQLDKEKLQINNFYDDLEKKNAGREEVISQLKLQRQADLTAAELREKERLEADKKAIEEQYETLNGSKPENRLARIKKQYDDELKELKSKYSKQLLTTAEFAKAEAAILKNQQAAITLSEKEKAQQGKDFAIQVAQDVSNATFSIISNNQKAELASKLKNIENGRTAELSKKNLTEKQKADINAKYDAQAKEEKLKAWKAERNASIAQALINGALAVTKALAQTGILAPFVIPGIIAGTLAQVAVIASQPAPEYAQGGMSNEDPAGYVSKATLFNNSASGRPFVAGEKGKEWIAPNWMVTSPRYANIIGSLEVARQEKRAYANGGFNQVGSGSGSGIAPADFSRLEGLMSEMISAQLKANNKKVVMVYSEAKKFMDDTQAAIIQQSA